MANNCKDEIILSSNPDSDISLFETQADLNIEFSQADDCLFTELSDFHMTLPGVMLYFVLIYNLIYTTYYIDFCTHRCRLVDIRKGMQLCVVLLCKDVNEIQWRIV